MNFSAKFYGLLDIIGIVFLALVLVGSYFDGADSLSILALLSPLSSPASFGFWFMMGGIVLLTVGVVGIIRQYFKNHRRLFTALAILLIPPLTFVTFVFACSFAFFSAPWFPLRSEITQVTVVDDSPLVLSVDVKAITSRDCIIEQAGVYNDNGTLVAQTSLNERIMFNSEVYKGLALAVLPSGSEITVTLNFNSTLPSGSYLARLVCWGANHGSSPFSIP